MSFAPVEAEMAERGTREISPSVKFVVKDEAHDQLGEPSSHSHHEPSAPNPYLAQLNAKLVACGAAKHSLKLDGLSERQRENVVKVFYNLLAQREEDQSHLESLSTAHKVITYDHERLCGQHKALKTRVIVAEKEKEGAKALMAGLALKLKNEQELHKLAKAETQKARTALNFVRTQAQHESKRREVQLERTMQNWQKLSTDNARMLASNWHTGVLVLNPIDQVVQAPRTDSFWDPSINDLNKTIESLQEECEAFRHVTLTTANHLASLLAFIDGEQEPERLSSSAFFTQSTSSTGSRSALTSSLSRSTMGSSQAQVQVSSSTSHPNNAHGRLREMMARLRIRAEAEVASRGQPRHALGASVSAVGLFEDDLEMERAERVRSGLEEKVSALERDLAESRNLVEEGRKMFAAFAESETAPETPDVVKGGEDSAQAPDEVTGAMEALREQLEQERQQNLVAAIKLGQDRAAFESERAKFVEEKRRRELEELLADPVVPVPVLSIPTVTPATPTSASKSLSPRSRHLLTSRAHPVISSPLRSGTSSNDSAGQRTPPVSSRRRSRKGPATPLARFVTHKLVAEKIASVKAQRTLKATIAPEPFALAESSGASGGSTSVSEWQTTNSEEEIQALRPSSKANRQRTTTSSSSSISTTIKTSKTMTSSIATARPRTGATASTAAPLSRSQSKAPSTAGLGASLSSAGQPRPANLFKASGVGPEAAARKRAGR